MWFVVWEWNEDGGEVGEMSGETPADTPAASARLRRLGYLILGKQFKRTIYAL